MAIVPSWFRSNLISDGQSWVMDLGTHLVAMGHKCGSTSGYETGRLKGWKRLSWRQARIASRHEERPIVSYIRDPWDRLRSALNMQGHQYALRQKFDGNVENFVKWSVLEHQNRHFLPQWLVHHDQQLRIDEWRPISEWWALQLGKANSDRVKRSYEWSEGFKEWFEAEFSEDFRIWGECEQKAAT